MTTSRAKTFLIYAVALANFMIGPCIVKCCMKLIKTTNCSFLNLKTTEKLTIMSTILFICGLIVLAKIVAAMMVRITKCSVDPFAKNPPKSLTFINNLIQNFLEHFVVFSTCFGYVLLNKADTENMVTEVYLLGLVWCLLRVAFAFLYAFAEKIGIYTLRGVAMVPSLVVLMSLIMKGFDVHMLDFSAAALA